MCNLNSIIIEGKLIADAKHEKTSSGTPLCTFVLESDRVFRDGTELIQEVSYFEVGACGHVCTSCADMLTKDSSVRIVGRLKQERSQEKDGKFSSKVIIVAEHIERKPIFED